VTPFILVLTLSLPGEAPQSQRVGVLISEGHCQAAGAGMVQAVKAARPDAVVAWLCMPLDVSA